MFIDRVESMRNSRFGTLRQWFYIQLFPVTMKSWEGLLEKILAKTFFKNNQSQKRLAIVLSHSKFTHITLEWNKFTIQNLVFS